MGGAGQGAAVELHDLEREGQADATAAALLLCGVERQENLAELAFRYLGAVVGDGDAGFAARGRCKHPDIAVLHAVGCLDCIADNVQQGQGQQAGIGMKDNIAGRFKPDAVIAGLGREQGLQLLEDAGHGDIGHGGL